MKQYSMKEIILIFNKYIDAFDSHLITHSEKVTYLFYKTLQYTERYSTDTLIQLSTLAMFHDIGAYKTEDAFNFDLLKFEMHNSKEHAIYGGLFIKYFSPLSDFCDLILYHHTKPSDFKKIQTTHKDEVILFSFIDMIATTMDLPNFNLDNIIKYYNKYPGATPFVELFLKADSQYDLINKIQNNSYKHELYEFFSTAIQTDEQIIEYAKMLNYTIDFRSESTFFHTLTVTSLSKLLAQYLGFDQETIKLISFGAAMHDIGKITTPLHILEKPGRLNDYEMEIMKEHVWATYNILKDIGFDHILELASYHHEKLDGSGYPFGLSEKDLTKEVRCVSVADILSALIGSRSYKKGMDKVEVLSILNTMSSANKIDSEIVAIVELHYDELMKQLKEDCAHIFLTYKQFKLEYRNLAIQFNEIFS